MGWGVGLKSRKIEKSKRRNLGDLRPAAWGDDGLRGRCKAGDTGRCRGRWWAVAKRQAASPLARKSCKSEGDNRRKKFWGMLVTCAAGMCWGVSRFGWFLGGNVEKSKSRNVETVRVGDFARGHSTVYWFDASGRGAGRYGRRGIKGDNRRKKGAKGSRGRGDEGECKGGDTWRCRSGWLATAKRRAASGHAREDEKGRAAESFPR
ncbi:hypothetical protein B7486_05045 [cyanobacterium TDX16]|nr:hypothetical protein B7486_05045 [cyanobacterium TDX16]